MGMCCNALYRAIIRQSYLFLISPQSGKNIRNNTWGCLYIKDVEPILKT